MPLLTIAFCAAVVCAAGYRLPAAPPQPPIGYKLGPGPWQAAATNLVLRDATRAKDLEVAVRYPEVRSSDPARCPVVVFSHGAGGSRTAFTALTTHWATHGYIVLLPTHADSIELRRRRGEDLSGLARNLDRLRLDVRPMDRLADVVFLLDSLGAIEERVPALRSDAGQGRIDRDRVGMAGHSAGALTTQMAFGVKVRGPGNGLGLRPRSVADPRIDVAILVSGQGTTSRMLTGESWNALDKPMLVITGSKDIAAIGNETPASRREPFDRAKPGDKYLVFIEGATHSSYQGKDRALALDPARPTDDELMMITQVTAASTLAFLDGHLKTDANARAYLQGDALVALSGRKATVERK